jgi:hypothetical protein
MMMENIGLLPNLIPEHHVFKNFEECEKRLAAIMEEDQMMQPQTKSILTDDAEALWLN